MFQFLDGARCLLSWSSSPQRSVISSGKRTTEFEKNGFPRMRKYLVLRQPQSNRRSSLKSQEWITRHLSRPLDWKFRSGERVSCSSKKNFNDSLPVGWPPGSIICPWSQRSHSSIIRPLTSFCFIRTRVLNRRVSLGKGSGWSRWSDIDESADLGTRPAIGKRKAIGLPPRQFAAFLFLLCHEGLKRFWTCITTLAPDLECHKLIDISSTKFRF